MLESLGNVWGLLVAVLGFGAIIFIHELGHFVAARWAGIRVFAFAIGFGPAALAWRKGIGFRRGSTNPDTMRALRERFGETAPSSLDKADNVWPSSIGKTEYRINWLPLGGYVQMRGQDDVSPSKAEADRGVGDSFVDKPVWKRMVVISAGVVMNVILALLLYIAVYMIGKPAAPPIIGRVFPDSPAALAAALNAESAGVAEPGLRAGDRVILVDGEEPREFADILLAGALANAENGIKLTVSREGVDETLDFHIKTARSDGAEFREIGVAAPYSTEFADAQDTDWARRNLAYLRNAIGIPENATRLRTLDGRELETLAGIEDAFTRGALPYTYESSDGVQSATLQASSELQRVTFEGRPVDHIAGFVPPMRVGIVAPGVSHDLRPGDVFVRIGRIEWPGPIEGTRAIADAAGGVIDLVVLRDGQRVSLTAPVSAAGTIGFFPLQSLDGCVVTRPLPASVDAGGAGRRAALMPGTRIVSANGAPVSDYTALRDALASAAVDTPIELGLTLPFDDNARTTATITLSQPEIDELTRLGWQEPPFFSSLFTPATITLQASNPAEAIAMGVTDTKKMILRTYLTLVRLVEGSVEVNQLRGPVGIAHIGTQVAQRSFPELLFFFAVISANLAVLNFLPIPIADGGMMVFLMIEAVTGKPVSPAVQNAAALIGLALLGSVFLIVTFNDLTRLL